MTDSHRDVTGRYPTSAARPPNVVLVTVDCLRRDRLSAYGYERQTTPFIDQLLDRALHCTSAHSPSCWTCPSICSLLTGLYPHRHGGGLVPGEPKNLSKHNLPTRLPDEVRLVSEILGARGYSAAAFGAVWNAHLSIPRRFPLMVMSEKPAARLVRRARRWLRAQDRPFFLWLHLGDAHEPLDVPRSMRGLFGPVPRVRKARRWDFTGCDSELRSDEFLRYREARTHLYDLAVRSADSALGQLWSELEEQGSAARTVFIVTSDHGEEFWEHREAEREGFSDPRGICGTGHGHNLFQVHLLVPLVIVGPGIEANQIDRNVTLVDVFPTIMQALDLEAAGGDGRSLLEKMDDRHSVLAEGVAYGHEKRSVIEGDLKLLSSPGDEYERMFRLGPDRREVEEVDDPADLERLRGLLPKGNQALGEQVEATEEITRHLRSLGYID